MCWALIAFASVLNFLGPVANGARGAVEWSIVRDRVHVGGCVQIIVEAPARLAEQCELSIGDHAPALSLGRLGSSVSVRGRTVVLVSHDLAHAEVLESTSDGSKTLRVPPVFREPGAVTITLYLDGDAVGTQEIDVLPATGGMREAIDLLFPVVDRNVAVREREDALRWLKLATLPSNAVAPPITRELLQQLSEELPIIEQHVDWAEVAEMLVARLEARAHYNELIVWEGRAPMLNVSGDALPPWPEIVTRRLESKPSSLFGQAIQNDIRGLVRDVRLMDARRRGDDIWPILEQAAKQEP